MNLESMTDTLAYQLAVLDGLTDMDMYHVCWSGGTEREPMGSVLELYYYPKAHALAVEVLKMVGWQEMESCPTGTYVLGIWRGFEPVVVKHIGADTWNDQFGDTYGKPDYWMPVIPLEVAVDGEGEE
jgi:hypothetical protein